MLNDLIREARHNHALYAQAVKENKPLSVILFWSNKKRDSEQAVKHATKWSTTKLIDVITNGADF